MSPRSRARSAAGRAASRWSPRASAERAPSRSTSTPDAARPAAAAGRSGGSAGRAPARPAPAPPSRSRRASVAPDPAALERPAGVEEGAGHRRHGSRGALEPVQRLGERVAAATPPRARRPRFSHSSAACRPRRGTPGPRGSPRASAPAAPRCGSATRARARARPRPSSPPRALRTDDQPRLDQPVEDRRGRGGQAVQQLGAAARRGACPRRSPAAGAGRAPAARSLGGQAGEHAVGVLRPARRSTPPMRLRRPRAAAAARSRSRRSHSMRAANCSSGRRAGSPCTAATISPASAGSS